jgi:hypothetical protein
MVSIQSLMDDRPYHNEPGFEKVISLPLPFKVKQTQVVFQTNETHETQLEVTILVSSKRP